MGLAENQQQSKQLILVRSDNNQLTRYHQRLPNPKKAYAIRPLAEGPNTPAFHERVGPEAEGIDKKQFILQPAFRGGYGGPTSKCFMEMVTHFVRSSSSQLQRASIKLSVTRSILKRAYTFSPDI
jgi:hypothetical protein